MNKLSYTNIYLYWILIFLGWLLIFTTNTNLVFRISGIVFLTICKVILLFKNKVNI